ncbi:transglycosylase domain-containing protein [Brevibacillus agri]|uniref:penicillin-binding protein 1A n=1 Tax=Brevibacillus TaxID=55080 RepID=UPI000271C430|nr:MULTISPECIES: penicillin-binding protein 1A [Brevibacillus]EJL43249.1 membrane carboxypeptidase (penicillin-binding protein) [Brevibacillus sp. CF112]MBG9565965.1 penicillin-binding protein [Brevibacillus agri]MBY0054458.1 transglycosylase domain-containing protein [Brevibacillus agri]MCG5250912.1 transglycosylase domain-containing protein [Brevibacillus agri]MDN4092112.1 transglycosylase domain-containing protein [Brevibacillus agri]
MSNNHTSSSEPSKKKRRRSRGRLIWVIVQMVFLLGLMGAAVAGGIVTGYVAALVKDEPVRSKEELEDKIFTNYLTGFAYYNDGSLIGQLRAEEGDRRLVKKADVSPYLINAIIATEDKNYYHHSGVSFQSTLRGAIQEFTNQPVVTGGSTITQQLVKNTILSAEVSHTRKAREIFSAIRIERMFSKDQILEAYMNEIYFGKNANGSNVYGVQAAAKGIFGKDVKELNLSEGSYLAGMIQNPGAYSPFRAESYQRGKERQKMVLDRMLENGYITQAQYDDALKADLKAQLAKPTQQAYREVPFLMMEIEERAARQLVDADLAEKGRDKSTIGRNEYRQLVEDKRRDILRKGYKVHTTIDKNVYSIMQAVAADPKNFGKNRTYTIRRSNGKTEKIENALEEVGAMLIHNKTGAILGMIGGRDFSVEQTNHATVPRQPGSAMKPLAAYAPAFELGLLQPASPIDDAPVLLADGQNGSHLPKNWNNKWQGIMSAREALRMSWNIPAIKTYLKVGIPTALEYVKKMGITTLVDADNYAATGVIGGLTYGTTAEEMTNAYATFANHGSFVDAYLIDRIEDSQGKVIYRHEAQPVQVYSEQTAYLITDMMRSVVNAGTGTHIRKFVPRKVDVAGKTGTTNNSNDLWFVGYTPELSMGVWVGFDEPYPMPDADKYVPMVVWGKVMKEIIEKHPHLSPPDATFQKPSGIVTATVDSKSGLLPSELSKQAGHLITDLFNRRFVPTKVDDSHQKARLITYNGERYLAKEGTPDDFVTEGIFYRSPDPLPSKEQIQAKNKSVAVQPPDWEQRLPDKEDPRTEVGGTPAAPSGVVASGSGKQIALSWQSAKEPDLVGYRIYRADAQNGFVKIATVKDPAELTFTDTTASQSDVGYYVTAVDIAGNESSPSAIASVGAQTWEIPGANPGTTPTDNSGNGQTTPGPSGSGDGGNGNSNSNAGSNTNSPSAAPPSAPKSLSIKTSGNSVKLSWKGNSQAEQVIAYNVYFSPDAASGYLLLDTVSATSYTHTASVPNGSYYITAVNSYGESPHSNNVTATTTE